MALRKIEKIPTGIEGLDKMLQGGIPRGFSVALVGGPGTGKTTAALQYLVNGIEKYNEPGAFFTLQSSVDTLVALGNEFGWPIEKYIAENKLILREVNLQKVEKFIETMQFAIKGYIHEYGVSRVVIDSIANVQGFYHDKFLALQQTHFMFEMLRENNCTTLVTGATDWYAEENNKFDYNDYIVDGLLFFLFFREGNARKRAIEILKMRGVDHDSNVRPLKIDKNGITVFSDAEVYRK